MSEKEFILPVCGKKVIMRQGFGRDLRNAQIKANETADINFALLAEICTFDGQKIIFDDLLDMDLNDVIELQSKMGKLTSQTNKVSSSSVTSQDGNSEPSGN